MQPEAKGYPPGLEELPPVRVLVVDDSAYVRHILSQHLNATPDLKVVGAARDGQDALDLIETLDPDVVTLDVEMPRLDGLSTLRQIMLRRPRPVVMISSRTTESAHETVRALMWGAVDCVAKPAARANIAAVMDDVISKIRVAARARVGFGLATTAPLRPPRPPRGGHRRVMPSLRARPRDKVVVIGASTGGPSALKKVLSDLPADLPAAVLIVQHIPEGFTRSLADGLNAVSAIPVREADEGDGLEVGQGLLAPAGYHLTLDADARVSLNQNPKVHGVRPAIDVTMAAVAQQFGRAAVGVVLTGMGSDGAHGAALIQHAGGRVLVESEATCVVWGMPRSVVEAGVEHESAPLPEMAEAIRRAVGD